MSEITAESATSVARRINPSAYHLFQIGGRGFLYSRPVHRFLAVDGPAYEVLAGAGGASSIEEIRAASVAKGGNTPEQVDRILDEIRQLQDHGMFDDPPTIKISDGVFESALAQRYGSSWNKLELALAESCNLACKYCYCSTSRDVPSCGLMSEGIARQAILWLFAMSGKSESVSITFFGGEPLLNKRVLAFAVRLSQQLGKLHGKKVHYSMTTNGTMLDQEVIDLIKRYNFGLMVSLDGPREIHDSQCPTTAGGPSFDMAVAGIRALMARRRSVTVRCTMCHPIPDMMGLIRYFDDFGFTRIVLGRAINPAEPSCVDFTDNDYVEYEKQESDVIIPWLVDLAKQGKTAKYDPYSGFIKDNLSGGRAKARSSFKCGACRGTSTVGANGDMYPCHRFVGMGKWVIGSIQNGPDIDKCKKFWRSYREATEDRCASCWMNQMCDGPCPWEMADKQGNFVWNERHCSSMERYIYRSVLLHALTAGQQEEIPNCESDPSIECHSTGNAS